MHRVVFALVRQGDYHKPKGVPSALSPYALNEAGIEQAAHAAPGLSEYAEAEELYIDRSIHCSRQQRAWQTASIIATELGQDFSVIEFQELSERSVGAAANLTAQRLLARFIFPCLTRAHTHHSRRWLAHRPGNRVDVINPVGAIRAGAASRSLRP